MTGIGMDFGWFLDVVILNAVKNPSAQPPADIVMDASLRSA